MDEDRSSKFLNLVPFGIPTLIIAEDPQLLAAARTTYAHWLAEKPVGEPMIELGLEIGRPSTTGVSLGIAVDGSRLRLKGGGCEGMADATSGKAEARIARETADQPDAVADILDTLLLFMLARRGRTPVHASAFMPAEVAIVLAGQSGSGKSTLALAAAQRGYPVLSDDMVFVQQEPEFALWGFPRPIHVFPEDAPDGDHHRRIRNDKVKAALPLEAPALRAERAVLVVLERGSELELQRIDVEEAIRALMNLDAGFDLLERESRTAIEALASCGAWRLTLSADPLAAVDFVALRLAN
jgi:hypothetical protein